MALRLAQVTFDCDDTLAVAGFWSAAIDRRLDPEASPYFASIGMDGDRVAYLFIKVPEPKTAKNRVHIDLDVDDRAAVQAEVARLTALGATVIRAPQEEWGRYWATMQDPEGNEFCIGAR